MKSNLTMLDNKGMWILFLICCIYTISWICCCAHISGIFLITNGWLSVHPLYKIACMCDFKEPMSMTGDEHWCSCHNFYCSWYGIVFIICPATLHTLCNYQNNYIVWTSMELNAFQCVRCIEHFVKKVLVKVFTWHQFLCVMSIAHLEEKVLPSL